MAHVLDTVIRRTLLLRGGYCVFDSYSALVSPHLISLTPFDIWDLILSEIEDTLEEGFKGHR